MNCIKNSREQTNLVIELIDLLNGKLLAAKNQHDVIIIRGMASVLQHHVIRPSLLIGTDSELFVRIPGRRNNAKGYMNLFM